MRGFRQPGRSASRPLAHFTSADGELGGAVERAERHGPAAEGTGDERRQQGYTISLAKSLKSEVSESPLPTGGSHSAGAGGCVVAMAE